MSMIGTILFCPSEDKKRAATLIIAPASLLEQVRKTCTCIARADWYPLKVARRDRVKVRGRPLQNLDTSRQLESEKAVCFQGV